MCRQRPTQLRASTLDFVLTTLITGCWLVGCQHSTGSLQSSQAQTVAAQQPEARPGTQPRKSIRNADLGAYVRAHVGELNPDLADLGTDCGEGQQPVSSIAPAEYGDLDGDGEEEAAIVGFSCMSGTGGADFFGVLKLAADGTIVALPIEEPPKLFKGRNSLDGLRGHLQLRIEKGRLLKVFPIYSGGEANCCPEGGERHFIYRWDGHKFLIDDIIDIPRRKDGAE